MEHSPYFLNNIDSISVQKFSNLFHSRWVIAITRTQRNKSISYLDSCIPNRSFSYAMKSNDWRFTKSNDWRFTKSNDWRFTKSNDWRFTKWNEWCLTLCHHCAHSKIFQDINYRSIQIFV